MGSPPGAMIPGGHLPRRQSGDDMKPPTSQTSAHAPTSATNGYAPSTMRPHQSALPRSANRRSPNPSPSLERLPEAHAHHTPGDSSISIAALRWLRPVVHRAAHKKFLLEANRRPPSLVDVSRGCHRGPKGGVAVTSGPACGCAPQLLHPARAPGAQWLDPGQRQQSARHRRDLGGLGSLRGKAHSRGPIERRAVAVARTP